MALGRLQRLQPPLMRLTSAFVNAAVPAVPPRSPVRTLSMFSVSSLAWRFLQPSVDVFMTIEDEDAIDAMRRLARGSAHDVPIESGESGAAGLAALRVLALSEANRAQAGLAADSQVLLISTEGATAPSVYRELAGLDAADVLRLQREWTEATP
jgi:diaminopropionate ammonia-lyase